MGNFSDRRRWEVMNRDGFRCCYCGATRDNGVQLEVDHIVPRAWGGTDALENLRTACRPCNAGKRDTLAVPHVERNNLRPARDGMPERFEWMRWGDWYLELSTTDPAWIHLCYQPEGVSEDLCYSFPRQRFNEPDWVDHIAMKCEGRTTPSRMWKPFAAIDLENAFRDLERIGLRTPGTPGRGYNYGRGENASTST